MLTCSTNTPVTPVMALDADTARLISDSTHQAWSNRNLSAMLNCFVDDLVYQCNVGPDGMPLTITGKEGLEGMLRPVLAVAESMSTIDTFRFENGVARAQVSAFVRHKATGLTLTGSYRQVITYRGSLISHLQEFHDAGRLAAFWRLVAAETERQNLLDLSAEG